MLVTKTNIDVVGITAHYNRIMREQTAAVVGTLPSGRVDHSANIRYNLGIVARCIADEVVAGREVWQGLIDEYIVLESMNQVQLRLCLARLYG